MASPYGIKTLIRRTFARRYALARLTRRPFFGRLVDRLLFEGDDLMVLPGDHVVPVNRSLAPREDTAVPSQVLEHLIRQATFHWKMDFCICRDASRCRDYPVEMGCLFLGDAARHINPKFGRRVSAQEALDHARRCRDLGLVHLIGRNKLDSVWLNAGPAEKLLTVCNCCPCCCLWKILPEISPVISGKLTRMPGIALRVTEACTGCAICTRAVCFVNAIAIKDGRAVIGEACRGCGRCVAACPSQAIELRIEDAAFIETAVCRISAVVEIA
jgi:ferredoxin